MGVSGILASLAVALKLDPAGLKAGVAESIASADQLKGKLESSATSGEQAAQSHITSFKKVAVAGAVAGLAIAGAAGFIADQSIEAAQQFQTSTAAIAASANISTGAADQIGKAFLSTAGQTTFSAQEMTSAYATVAGQLGMTEGHALSSADALTVMHSAMDLSEASGESLASSTQDVANVLQVYHLGVNKAADASNVLYNTARVTGVGVAEVAQAVDRLKGRLGDAAPSLQDTSTLMVELSSHGIQGSRGIMIVNTAMNTLTAGGKATNKELASMGVHLYDAQGHFIGMQAVIGQLGPKLSKMSDAQRDVAEKSLFGASAAKALDGVIRSGAAGWDTAAKAVNSAGAAHAAAEKRAATLEGQEKKLRSTLSDTAVTIGTALVPLLTKLLNAVMPLITAIANWISQHQQLATVILIVAGGLGLLVAGITVVAAIVGPLVGLVSAVAGVFAFLSAVWETATVAGWGVALAELGISWPLLLIVAAVIAVIAIGVLLITHWKQVSAVAEAVWHAVSGFFTALWHDIVNAVGAVISWVRSNWPLILAILTGPIGLFVLFVSSHWDQIVGFFKAAPGRIVGALGNLGGMLESAGEQIIQGFLSGIESKFKDVQSFVGGIGSWIASHKGPLEYDRQLLVPHGAAMMAGFHDSLAAGFAKVQNLIGSTAPKLAANVAVQTARTPSFAGAGGVARGGGATVINLTVNNPTPEPASTSLNRELRKVGYLRRVPV